MLEISREYVFDAAHHLPQTPEDHKCHRLHGHTYRVRVWVTGPCDPLQDWIVDYATLDLIWRNAVHAVLDHRCLNDEIANPTTERLTEWIYVKMADPLVAYGVTVTEIEVCEGESGRCRLKVETNG